MSMTEIQDYIKESILTSTTHGVDKIVRSRRTFLKVLWAIFFVVSTGACGYFITKSILDYLNYEVVTKIQVINEVPQLFPTVSICNAQAFSTNASLEFAKNVLTKAGISDPFYNTTSYAGFYMTPSQVDLLVKYVVTSNFKNPNITDLKQFGVSYDQFFLSCTYNLAICDPSMFEWYFDNFYGSCYRFNYEGTIYTYRASDLNGLRFELYIPDLTDVYSFASDMGARIIIHNASITSTSLIGVNVKAQVGAQTNIQVERQFIHKLESPYSECIQDLASYGSDLYPIFVQLGQQYTQTDCYGLCYQKYLVKACGCIDATFLPLPNELVCLSIKGLNCNLENYLYFFGNGSIKEKCGNECPLECDSETFELTISSSSYPTKAYANQLVNYSGNILANFYSNMSTVTYEDLKENFLAVNIYYGEMKYTSIEELEKTRVFDLISGIGGTLGLFMGMSFLSFFEIVDIFIEILFILTNHKSRNNEVSQFI